ncbi:MAG: cation transporter [Clostridiales bacterium]|jgi:cation diffusion facilitator family transporter|nr:cation transporter [Clostridiales bacterium]
MDDMARKPGAAPSERDAAVDKTEAKNAFKSQQKVAFMAFLSELPNLIAVLAAALLSGSLILALDAFDSLANASQSFLSFSLSKKLQGDSSFQYDYGMGKLEALGSFASAMLLFIGLAIVLAASVFSFLNPDKPGEMLPLAIALKIVNVAIDLWLLSKQIKTVKGAGSGFIDSNVMLLKKNLIFDAAALFTVAVSYMLRDISLIVYLDPAMCVGCALYIGALNIKLAGKAVADLLDKTLEEKTQFQILGCVSKIWGDIEGFQGIRTRRSGSLVYIDLMVSFDGNTSYDRIRRTYEAFSRSVKEVVPNSVAAIVIGENGGRQTEGSNEGRQ